MSRVCRTLPVCLAVPAGQRAAAAGEWGDDRIPEKVARTRDAAAHGAAAADGQVGRRGEVGLLPPSPSLFATNYITQGLAASWIPGIALLVISTRANTSRPKVISTPFAIKGPRL